METANRNPAPQQAEAPAAAQAGQPTDAEKNEAMQEQAGLAEKIAQLERLVRAAGRDSLTMVRAQQESQAALQSVSSRLADLELDLKGVSQAVWRAAQESQQAMKGAEEHYAGALRDLEKRIRDEMLMQAQRGAMRALLPALDDLDLILSQQLRQPSAQEDPFLKGVRLVRGKLMQGLREQGFEEIPVEAGKTAYDPKAHDAVEADVPESFFRQEGCAPQTILFVRRAGFTYMGQVFRVPQVFIKRV